MQKIGYSLINQAGAELSRFPALPSSFRVPGEKLFIEGVKEGWTHGNYSLVETWQEPDPMADFKVRTEDSVVFDGTKVVVNVTYTPWSQAELDQKADAEKEAKINVLTNIGVAALLNHENRIRTLEGKGPVTEAQLRAALKALV